MEIPPKPLLAIIVRAGAVLLGAAFVAFAVQNFTQAGYILGLEPLPASLPGRPVWEILNSLLLLGAGGGIVAQRLRRRSASVPASVLGALLILWIVLLQARGFIGDLNNDSRWAVLCETVALASGAWVLAGVEATPGTTGGVGRGWPFWSVRVGRIAFAITLLGFAIFHIKDAAYIIYVLPSWLPWHAFWCYFTCAAFVAAALSIFSGVLAPWGAFWAGVMFLSWVLILHLPRVLHAAQAVPYKAESCRDELSSMLVCLAMGGCAWVLAESYAARRTTA